MSFDREHAAVRKALERWAAGDLEGTLAQFSEDVLYLINVDGIAVPFASSTLGKEDLRHRLHLILHMFQKESLVHEPIVHEADHTRVVVLVQYKHKGTGERLCARVRLCYWVENGLIVRVEERRDARYIEAFQRFVQHIEKEARGV